MNPFNIVLPSMQRIHQPQQLKLHVSVDLDTLAVISVGDTEATQENILKVEVDHSLYSKFITGEENPSDWVLGPDRQVVKRASVKPADYNLIDVLSVMQISIERCENADVSIIIDEKRNLLKIYYSFEQINLWKIPLKLYFTRFQDPAYLKSSVDINMNTLCELRDRSNLKKIPNPLVVSVQEADDLSIFTPRTDLKFSVEVI